MQLSINSTDSAWVSVANKFASSHALLCPITEYVILDVVDSTTRQSVKDYETMISFGTATDSSADDYFPHLTLNDTSESFGPYHVYVQAKTSDVKSTYESYVATIEVLPPPNFPPEFSSTLRTVIVLDWAGEEIK
mmetsp:Transcript_24944/g.38742  ORF Transcript_24944/g.38742 Transcript_24944/m.38742 type:complete len:135 (+) Transcript_24944:1317-1721(+)